MAPDRQQAKADRASVFWTFSLETYQKPGVKEQLLTFQNRDGADINLILLACWLGMQRKEISSTTAVALREESELWQSYVLAPLRSIRNYLKSGTERDLRDKVLTVELDAEQQAQRTFIRRLPEIPEGRNTERDSITGNLKRLASKTLADKEGVTLIIGAVLGDAK